MTIKDNSIDKTILLVDDDEEIHEWVKRLFGETYGFTFVESIAKARDALGTTRFDLVILDQQLDDGQGTDLLSQMRTDGALGANKQCPVIMLTASRNSVDYEDSLFLGSMAYVNKPIDFAELSEALRSALATR